MMTSESPPPSPPPSEFGDRPTIAVVPPSDFDRNAAAAWRERERQQRSIRLLMMFLMMLLLMDGDNANNRNRRPGLRRRSKRPKQTPPMHPTVLKSRQTQEERLKRIAYGHPRYQALLQKNGGRRFDLESSDWAQQQLDQYRDEFGEDVSHQALEERDKEEARRVYHYPWNSTGFYRGEWKLLNEINESDHENRVAKADTPAGKRMNALEVRHAAALEERMTEVLKSKNDNVGVFLIPEGLEIATRDDHNLTLLKWEEMRIDTVGKIYRPWEYEKDSDDDHHTPKVTLVHDSGRAAFQLFSRPVPSMKELSLVDGFVKLYDSTSPGYSSKKDILLRVRGVLIHAIGKLSLVANVPIGKSALVIGHTSADKSADAAQRRLSELLRDPNTNIDLIRDSALVSFSESVSYETYEHAFESSARRLSEATGEEEQVPTAQHSEAESSVRVATVVATGATENVTDTQVSEQTTWSDIVLPYPYVRDDQDENIRRVRTPVVRMMPAREQALEANAKGCGFEINMYVEEVEWTVGAWRRLILRKLEELKRLTETPSESEADASAEKNPSSTVILPGSKPRGHSLRDEALVMAMIGTIESKNCNFLASVNATALRTDWDATTSKAINYSFYMMIVCLTQILILLRQLLHSQSQSAATRVSLLCVGWQTVVDALVCLAHIYLSLAMQPLFTAFASVAFFKLLIFCVIEMKYMAIIIQARNSSNGGQTTEVFRRQVAMLHLRFYVALFGTFLLIFYAGDKYRTLVMLGLYSFWVPQIILNVVTEAKTPLHKHYIYGMSITRLVAPLYIFAVPNNFLKEAYPDSPSDQFTCQMLILWVALQTAVLIGQGKYGARFMIPARFLPPKFDYSRPIPSSMLPPGALDLPVSDSMDGRDELRSSSSNETQALLPNDSSPRSRHTTSQTTRNRMRGNRANRPESGMIAEEPAAPQSPVACTLDCSICYEAIDVRNHRDYMLAPCNHLFHRECLIQWMDIKMECPICRTNLPAL